MSERRLAVGLLCCDVFSVLGENRQTSGIYSSVNHLIAFVVITMKLSYSVFLSSWQNCRSDFRWLARILERMIMCPGTRDELFWGKERPRGMGAQGGGAKGHEVRRNEAVVCFE